ncbi:ABC transporter ATP-binding protein [Trueperella pecoris]|uniref:ABC transporter ATP-binding protein n=1 Tax=Trueperella pecoris TaxID=2733571 RepID=A0A7M1R442_9ACTO|nr:ABC transporter ATP-binding protein [Trueperella pecoris]
MTSILAVTDLTFRYRPSLPELFDGLSYTFTPGVTAITGPSGRGKSTLLYILGMLLKPESGTISLLGEELTALKDHDVSRIRAQKFGFVFQDSELDPSRPILDSVIEPGLYAGRRRSALLGRAHYLLTEVGLAERARHRPAQVSGGQAQRVALCRALINNPAVVLADEPTGNLDPVNSAIVLDALCDMGASGRAVIIATHDPVVLERADEVLAL